MARSYCYLWCAGQSTVVVAAPNLRGARAIVRNAAKKNEHGEDWAKEISETVRERPMLTIETRPTAWAGIVMEHHLVTKTPEEQLSGLFYVNAETTRRGRDPGAVGGLWPPRKAPSTRRS